MLELDPKIEREAAKIRAEWDEVTEYSRKQISPHRKGKLQRIPILEFIPKIYKVITDDGNSMA